MSTTAVELGTVLVFFNGKAPPKDEDGDFVVYGSNGTIGKAKCTNHENAIILGRVGAYCGSVEFCDEKFWASDNTIVVKTKNGFDLKYMYYRLKSFPLRSYAGGAAQPLLTQTILRGVRLPVVKDKNRQVKIASILSTYDDLIENNRRRIALLEQTARLLYKEWFVHLRFPGHEHTRIVDGVPAGWENTFLPDVIDVNPKTPVEKGKNILYIPMSALSEAGMTANTADFEYRTTHTAVKFKKSDVLLARITPCLENGKTGYVYFLGDEEIACGSTEFIVLRGKRVSPAFTYCLARSYPFRGNAIKSMIGSSGRQRVQVSCFDEYKVPLPHKHLLEMFDYIATTAFDQIRVLVEQNDKLTKARDLLLPKLMNGEVAV
jgi:type I restriction enzyme S subunit